MKGLGIGAMSNYVKLVCGNNISLELQQLLEVLILLIQLMSQSALDRAMLLVLAFACNLKHLWPRI